YKRHLSTTSNSQTPNSTMAKTKELSKDTRNKIVDLHQAGKTESAIVNLQKLHKSLTGIMSFLYISILLFAACVETQVSARVGSTAVLPCEWKNVSIQTFHVEWYVDSEIVFERNGEELFEGAGYEGRLDVPKDDLLKGNCSLVLKNVTVTDAVIYRSAMVLPETKKSVLVQTVKLSIDGEAGINCPCPLILIISFLVYLFFSH
ncbi:hypothetical protein QTP86_028034, partial [Hemibagrus guttatus]